MNNHTKYAWSRFTRGAMLFAGLVAAILALHPGIWNAGWRFDDPQMLEFVVNHSITRSFYDPATWRELGAPFFTPLLTLSYWIDYKIFGLNPLGFYLHQIAALALALVLSYRFMEREINAAPSGKIWAAMGAIFFLSGMPAFVVTEQVMTRHYIEGLCLALVAYHLHQRGGTRATILSAACYLLAILAKEIYIPLPFLLFYTHWVRTRNIKTSIKSVAWHAAVLVFYGLLRTYMLQGIGGYSEQLIPSKDYLADFLEAGKSIVFFKGFAGWVLLALVLGRIFQSQKNRQWGIAYALSLAALSILPLFPVIAAFPADVGNSYFIFNRYFFLPWWLLCMAFVYACVSIAGSKEAARPRYELGAITVFGAMTVALIALSFYDISRRHCFNVWASTGEDIYLAQWHERPLLGSAPPSELEPYLRFMGDKVSQIKSTTPEVPPDITAERLPRFSGKIQQSQHFACRS